jgi:hypothetical protein
MSTLTCGLVICKSLVTSWRPGNSDSAAVSLRDASYSACLSGDCIEN